MDAEPDISFERIAAFVRQHTHDLRNGLNGLDLETALLDESVVDEEGRESLQRVRKQVRSLADQLRSLSARFQKPQPVTMPIVARELLLIWQEKHAALPKAPEVRWVDGLGEEKVQVDVEMMAMVFRELLTNAAAFAHSVPMTAEARIEDGNAVFELREPKQEELDPSTWGEPFAKSRRGSCGLGLWTVRRLVEANGAKIVRGYLPESSTLTTQLILAVV